VKQTIKKSWHAGGICCQGPNHRERIQWHKRKNRKEKKTEAKNPARGTGYIPQCSLCCMLRSKSMDSDQQWIPHAPLHPLVQSPVQSEVSKSWTINQLGTAFAGKGDTSHPKTPDYSIHSDCPHAPIVLRLLHLVLRLGLDRCWRVFQQHAQATCDCV